MSILSSIKTSIIALQANKLRTALTVLGIVIGIASVIIVFSAGAGIEDLILGQVETFGTNIIETEIKVPTNKKGSNTDSSGSMQLVQGAQITTLTLDDMADLNKLPNVKDSYAGIMGQEQVGYGNELEKAALFGTNASYIDIDKSEVEFGRFYTEEEDKSLAEVVVLGSKIKDKLFGDTDPLGKTISIRKKKFRVLGVMKERGAVMTMDLDNYVYVPVRTLQKRIMGIDHVLYIVSELENNDLAADTALDARRLLRENHNITVEHDDDYYKDDFRVSTMTEMMDLLSTITGAITLLLLAIVAISLVVGGVGIMNIMYVVVTERTAEIGLRKAVGASYSDIMWQFLIESVLITILGGILGILIGVGISWLIAFGANRYGLDWKFSVPLKAFITSLGFSCFFGLAFGLYPARKAARLQPVEALRSE